MVQGTLMRQSLLCGQQSSLSQLCPSRNGAACRPHRNSVRVYNAAQPYQRYPLRCCCCDSSVEWCSRCGLYHKVSLCEPISRPIALSLTIADQSGITLKLPNANRSSACRGSSSGRKRDISADALAGYSKGISIDQKEKGLAGLPTDRYGVEGGLCLPYDWHKHHVNWS